MNQSLNENKWTMENETVKINECNYVEYLYVLIILINPTTGIYIYRGKKLLLNKMFCNQYSINISLKGINMNA